MTTSTLHRSVARQTGESLSTVRAIGFQPLEDLPLDDEPTHLALDCPCCGAQVPLTEHGLANLPEFAECYRCDAAYGYEYSEVYKYDPDASACPDEIYLAVA